MSLSATVRALVQAGATPEMILAVVEVHEATTADALAARRDSDAKRQRARREREEIALSRDVTLPAPEVADTSPHVGEPAQVVTPSLPSLPSEVQEELKPPVKPKGLTAPKGQTRGSRLPENWHPLPTVVGDDLTLPGDRWGVELDKFRDYWRAVPGAKGLKLDWDATWRNWLRRASETSARKAPHERPHPDAKYDARQANLAAFERGADLAARFHGKP